MSAYLCTPRQSTLLPSSARFPFNLGVLYGLSSLLVLALFGVFSPFFLIIEIKVNVDECFCFFLQNETLMGKETPQKVLQFPNNNKQINK